MNMRSLRLAVQHVSFLVFTYGGHFRISLSSYIPCFSCPFVFSCGGQCYLMVLQRGLSRLLAPLAAAQAPLGEAMILVWANLRGVLYGLLVFSILAVLLGKSWCGWLCPFGVVQDWVGRLRRLLRIRQSALSPGLARGLSPVKYVLLAYLVILPAVYSLGWLSREFSLAWCRICPARLIMPLFAKNWHALGLDASSTSMLIFSLALLSFTGAMLIGMFLRDRFFCTFCPMLALLNLYRRLYLLKLVKEPSACLGCGTCRRTCAMGNDVGYLDKGARRLYSPECLGCFKCADSCAGEGSLGVFLGPLRLFSSSRRNAARG